MGKSLFVFVGYVVKNRKKVDWGASTRNQNLSWKEVASSIIQNNPEITKDNIIYIEEYSI
ncbi:MAG: hypothetical protein VW577_06845 [Pelagibacteraceae bacterium]